MNVAYPSTYKNRNLAKGLLGLEILLALVLFTDDINWHDFEGHFQLLQRHCNNLRTGGNNRPVNFENHSDWQIAEFADCSD